MGETNLSTDGLKLFNSCPIPSTPPPPPPPHTPTPPHPPHTHTHTHNTHTSSYLTSPHTTQPSHSPPVPSHHPAPSLPLSFHFILLHLTPPNPHTHSLVHSHHPAPSLSPLRPTVKWGNFGHFLSLQVHCISHVIWCWIWMVAYHGSYCVLWYFSY